MNDALMTYFNGEKSAGLVLAVLGLIGLAIGAVLMPARFELRPFGITLALLAAVEVAIGVGLYLRTDGQVAALLVMLSSDGARFLSEEGARMVRVQAMFAVALSVETGVIVVGAVVALAQRHRFSVAGIALALVLHAALLLAFDAIAERRGSVWNDALARAQDATGSLISRSQ